MRVDRTAQSAPKSLDPATFTGTGSRWDGAPLPELGAGVVVVRFDDGARTHWHRHAGGQVLFVLDGDGRTATRAQPEVELAAGDVVYVEPDEEHWHGARPGCSMRHVALSFGTTVWLEPVDSEASDG